jgi:hypothetical protein
MVHDSIIGRFGVAHGRVGVSSRWWYSCMLLNCSLFMAHWDVSQACCWCCYCLPLFAWAAWLVIVSSDGRKVQC